MDLDGSAKNEKILTIKRNALSTFKNDIARRNRRIDRERGLTRFRLELYAGSKSVHRCARYGDIVADNVRTRKHEHGRRRGGVRI